MLASLSDTLAANPILLLFGVVAIGFAAGRVRVGGFSLGIAAVLFAGIGVGAIDDRFVLPDAFWILGLALFVYTVGLASGPGFLSALRRRGLAVNALVLAAIVAASLVAVAGHELLGLSAARATGAFTGGETNTPALAAAIETLKGKTGFARLAAEPIVGYSLAYPLGVVLPLLVVWFVLRRERRRPTSAPPPPLVVQTVLVEHRAGTLEELRDRHDGRLRPPPARGAARGGRGDTRAGARRPALGRRREGGGRRGRRRARPALDRGDRARPSRPRLPAHRRQLARSREPPDRRARSRRALRRVRDAGRRGDIDLVADPDTQLELGDRIRIVAPPSRMKEIATFFGDSYRALGEIDAFTFSLGIAAGLALGAVSVPIPGGHFSLGSAGGPLVVGLVLGAVGRTGPLVWQPSYTASLTLRQLGMVLFLAGIGLRAGPSFSSAISESSALLAVATGAAATTAALAVLLVGGMRFLHMPGRTLVGVVAGMQTQPAVLAYASDQLDDDRELTLGYASVYPLAVIAKIVIAQVVISLLL